MIDMAAALAHTLAASASAPVASVRPQGRRTSAHLLAARPQRTLLALQRGRQLSVSTHAAAPKPVRPPASRNRKPPPPPPRVVQVRDYAANATDSYMLRLHPTTELSAEEVASVFPYPRNLREKYKLVTKIGSGNFGTVYEAVERETGRHFACKCIPKIPRNKRYSCPHHLLKIRSEVDCMAMLGASLDAVFLQGVYEDDDYVHMVMELCTGGELLEQVDISKLQENDIAMIIRSVLRFLAQAHSKGLVYRDVKPGNFLFSHGERDAHLKATDFGLMIQHNAADPPMSTPAGTPIYLAPEVIMRSYGSQADVYSAGVLAFQLLTGRYPYWPSMDFPPPKMKQLFDLITTDPIDFSALPSEGVSRPAIDLLQGLLDKNPRRRLTAAAALKHPFLAGLDNGPDCDRPLAGTTVQRLQRFAVNGHLKQFVLNDIVDDIMTAGDLLNTSESRELIDPLRDLFVRIDTDASGDVSVDDLVRELVDEGYFLSEDEVWQLMSRMDLNGDGRLDFDEFATCLMDWQDMQKKQQWEDVVLRAFERLDLNGDGFIEVDELATMLTKRYITDQACAEEAHNMMREFDLNGDGRISWEEFRSMLMDCDAPTTLEFFDRRLGTSFMSDSWVEASSSLSASLEASQEHRLSDSNAMDSILSRSDATNSLKGPEPEKTLVSA